MKKVALLILDGWGIGDKSKSDAISNANTPFVDSLYLKHPHSTLKTSGENVGLPEGQMGNSEVGHLNIGAGRIVYQDLALINKAIKEKTIDDNKTLNDAFNYAMQHNKAVHFLGLVSGGGVHSSQHYEKESFFTEIANLVTRRDISSVSAATALKAAQSERIGVKLNRKIGPVDNTLDMFRKIAADDKLASFIIGK
ncbi:MAG TPA: major capsid protein, partial [Bacteroidia bacterium]|nr:major capsid protein [Bacteroidia bacterium]